MKITFSITVVVFLAILTWANWSEPKLSERYKTTPAKIVMFELTNVINRPDSIALRHALMKIKGVKSISIRALRIAILYESDANNVEWKSMLNASKLSFLITNSLTSYSGNKCPVPAEYFSFISNLKMVFCFR